MVRAYKVPGDMDAAAMKAQRQIFEEMANCGEDVVIDMSDVDFIDSSGVGAIVFVYKRLLAGSRKVTLQRLNGQPKQLLTYLRLTDLVAK